MYKSHVQRFSEKVRAAAARRGFVMQGLSDHMTSVYADLCFDAIHRGYAETEEGVRVKFTEQDIEEDMYNTMGCKALGSQHVLTQFQPAEAVETMAAAGVQLEHRTAFKMSQEMVAMGGGGGGGK